METKRPRLQRYKEKNSRISKIFDKIRGKFRLLVHKSPRELRILLLGLDSAGKTTLVNQLKLMQGKPFKTEIYPTMGLNLETITLRNLRLEVMDIGGQLAFRETLWKDFFLQTSPDLLVYVVDSAENKQRMEEAKEAFWEVAIFLKETKKIDIVVLANKQDLNSARPMGVVAHELLRQSSVRARREKISYKQAIQNEEVLMQHCTEEELDLWLDPHTYLGKTIQIIEQVILALSTKFSI